MFPRLDMADPPSNVNRMCLPLSTHAALCPERAKHNSPVRLGGWEKCADARRRRAFLPQYAKTVTERGRTRPSRRRCHDSRGNTSQECAPAADRLFSGNPSPPGRTGLFCKTPLGCFEGTDVTRGTVNTYCQSDTRRREDSWIEFSLKGVSPGPRAPERPVRHSVH